MKGPEGLWPGKSPYGRTSYLRKNILIVEDDTTFRQSAADLLTYAGFNVLQAPDGESALRLLDKLEGTVDLLIIDLSLPDVNGFELIQLASRRESSIKVVATTGVFSDFYLEVAEVIGAHASLQKPDLNDPVSTDEWLKSIADLLGDGRNDEAGSAN